MGKYANKPEKRKNRKILMVLLGVVALALTAVVGVLAWTAVNNHIIDGKLERESEFIQNGYSDEKWRSLNPASFTYVRDSDDGVNQYLDYSEYFIDDYSATASSEDRARLLEYASYGDWYPFEVSAPLREKLAYYSRCIRMGFDTAGWPEKTIWEKVPW